MAGPRWVKLDVDYFNNPKVVGLSKDATLLHIASMAYCGAHLTDGQIPAGAMPILFVQAGASRRHLAELVTARLLYEVDGDYLLHDFTAMNGTRAEALERMEAERQRKAKWRAAKRRRETQE
jgi:hypothetical protein